MTTTTPDAIELFFAPPSVEPKPPGTFGVLHLLRRDIAVCFDGCPDCAHAASRALWAGTIAVMAGIDLLGRFLTTDGDNVRGRFCAYLTQRMHVDGADAGALWCLRDSLVHSFGLFAAQRYRFILSQDGQLVHREGILPGAPIFTPTAAVSGGVIGSPERGIDPAGVRIVQPPPVELVLSGARRCWVNVQALSRAFEDSIAGFRELVETDGAIGPRFGALFEEYGQIRLE